MLVCFKPLLHAVKQIIVDDLRNAPRHDNIVPVIFADIHAIPENARNAVVRVFFAAHGFDVALLQISQNVRYLLAAVVHFKNRSHNGCTIGVDAIFVIRIDGISGRETGAVELAFERAFPHSAFYVLREVRGIIFGETFEHAFEDAESTRTPFIRNTALFFAISSRFRPKRSIFQTTTVEKPCRELSRSIF